METVSDFMSGGEVFCSTNTPLKSAAKLMRKYNCGKLTIIDSDHGHKRVVGILSTKDLCFRSLGRGLNPLELNAGDCMTTPAIVVKLDCPIHDCFKMMKSYDIERMPVVDNDGSFCGEISLNDLEFAVLHLQQNIIHLKDGNQHLLQSQ